MDWARIGGYALLAGAGGGVIAAVIAPRQWGRPGSVALVGGLSVLAARDTAMIASGTLGRLQVLPRYLMIAELLSAGAAISLGTGPWLLKPDPRHSGSGNEAASKVSATAQVATSDAAARSATMLAAATFAIHMLRQAIYLTPGQGRRAGSPGHT